MKSLFVGLLVLSSRLWAVEEILIGGSSVLDSLMGGARRNLSKVQWNSSGFMALYC